MLSEGYDFPILESIYKILYEGAQAKKTLRELTPRLK